MMDSRVITCDDNPPAASESVRQLNFNKNYIIIISNVTKKNVLRDEKFKILAREKKNFALSYQAAYCGRKLFAAPGLDKMPDHETQVKGAGGRVYLRLWSNAPPPPTLLIYHSRNLESHTPAKTLKLSRRREREREKSFYFHDDKSRAEGICEWTWSKGARAQSFYNLDDLFLWLPHAAPPPSPHHRFLRLKNDFLFIIIFFVFCFTGSTFSRWVKKNSGETIFTWL